jgi:hypothetical protein
LDFDPLQRTAQLAGIAILIGPERFQFPPDVAGLFLQLRPALGHFSKLSFLLLANGPIAFTLTFRRPIPFAFTLRRPIPFALAVRGAIPIAFKLRRPVSFALTLRRSISFALAVRGSLGLAFAPGLWDGTFLFRRKDRGTVRGDGTEHRRQRNRRQRLTPTIHKYSHRRCPFCCNWNLGTRPGRT